MEATRLQGALDHRIVFLGMANDFRAGIDPDLAPPDLWDPSWLPIVDFGHGGNFAVECGGAHTDSSPVWRYETSKMPGRQVAGSLADLVNGWIRLIDDGWWEWDDEYGRWRLGQDRPPADLADFQV